MLLYCTGSLTYRYTLDLLALEAQHSPKGDIADPRPINTPLHREAWQACLRLHPDQELVQYLMRGFTQGFWIGFDYRCELKGAKKNMHSATQHPMVIDNYLPDELKASRVLRPFQTQDISPSVHVSRFGVIPKKHRNAWRLIVDLSAPDTLSVNDGISPELCSLEYTKISDVVTELNKMGPGTLLAKIDIKSAYHIIPVHPADRHQLGMSWKGGIYVNTTLPFGLRSAPKFSML